CGFIPIATKTRTRGTNERASGRHRDRRADRPGPDLHRTAGGGSSLRLRHLHRLRDQLLGSGPADGRCQRLPVEAGRGEVKGYQVEDVGLDEAELLRQDPGYWDETEATCPFSAHEDDLLNHEAELQVPPEYWYREREAVRDAIRPATGTVSAHRIGR